MPAHPNTVKTHYRPHPLLMVILVNIALSLAWWWARMEGTAGPSWNHLFLLSLEHLRSFKIWTLLTYAIAQMNLAALLVMVTGTLVLLPVLERLLTPGRLLQFGMYSALSAGFFHCLLAPEHQTINGALPVLGAMIVLALQVQQKRVLLKWKHFQITGSVLLPVFFLGNLLWLGLWSAPYTGSFAAHLGAMLFAVLFFRKNFITEAPAYKEKTPPQGFEAWIPSKQRQDEYTAGQGRPADPNHDPESARIRMAAEIDLILEKIHDHGFNSLSTKEKDLLKKASRTWSQTRND